MSVDNNSISIKDNNSQIISILPNELVEPLIMMAKIKGYDGIDDYVIHLVIDDLISIREGGQGLISIGESVVKYLEKNEYLEKASPTPNPYDDKEEDEQEEESKEDLK
jgi:hypothetical protein